MTTKKHVLLILLLAFIVACSIGYMAGTYASKHSIRLNSYGNPIGGSFRLMDSTSGTMTDELFAHQWLVVLFGALHCSHDACTPSLVNMATALNHVDAHKHSMQILFVSLDPNRDDPGHMRQYINHLPPEINSRIVMGSASPKALEDLTREYHEPIKQSPNPEWKYTMDMSPQYRVMAPHMRYSGSIDSHASAEKMEQELTKLISVYKHRNAQ